MLKTYLYIPPQLAQSINQAARVQKRSKAEIMREALEKGITAVQRQGIASAQAMLKIAEIGKKYNLKGPRDGSEKMDEYLWGKDWSKDE